RESASPEPSIRLPGNPHTVEFWTAYKEALGTEPPAGKTFDDLIAAYKFSPEFARLSDTSKREYTRYLETISELMGKFHVSALRPKHVIQLRDKFAATPVPANHLIPILRVLIAWGIPREFSDTNPCIHVPKLPAHGLFGPTSLSTSTQRNVSAVRCYWRTIVARGRRMCSAWPQSTSTMAG